MPNLKVQAAVLLAFIVLSGIFVQYVYSRGPMEPNVKMKLVKFPQSASPGYEGTFNVKCKADPGGDFKIYVYNGFHEDINPDNVERSIPVHLTENWKTVEITFRVPESAPFVGKTIEVQVRDNRGIKTYKKDGGMVPV